MLKLLWILHFASSVSSDEEDVHNVFVSVDNVAKLPYLRLLLHFDNPGIAASVLSFCIVIFEFEMCSSCSRIGLKELMTGIDEH